MKIDSNLNNLYINKKLPILFLIAIIFMSIGYASVNSVLATIGGIVQAKEVNQIFITKIDYVERDNKLPLENYNISYADETVLNSTISLEPNDITSEVSLKVLLTNKSEDDYVFKDVVYDKELISEIPSIYDNENIKYEFTNKDEIIEKNGGTLEVILTFKYDTLDENTSNILNSLLSFKFVKYIPVNVKFDANGGTVNIASKEVIYNYKYGELPVAVKEGYTFTGWAIEKAGKELITENHIVNIETEHTLYAQWNAKSYTIRYNANGGEGTMIDQVIKYDAVVPLSTNEFTKKGYSFLGWALTPDGEKKYNDNDNVVNLLLEGTVDLYALWAEDSYTVTFDYNGGTGTTSSMEVIYGKKYGSLPEYPHKQDYIFNGWFTAKTGGNQVFAESIVETEGNHTLYAQWDAIQYNDAIQNVVAKNVPDLNRDGIIDSIYLSFTCSSSYEKYNIPIKNLIVGQKYKLKYVASNNGSFGDSEAGYKNSMYGSIITSTASLSPGSIKTESIADGGLIAEWSEYSKGDKWLNGPFTMEMVFTAEASNMYWTWDFGIFEDGVLYDFNITNIVLEPVIPKINFSNKKLILHTTSAAKVINDVSDTYSNTFTFDGDGYAETLYYPITDLTAGSTYSITFEHLYDGVLIDDSSKTSTIRYDYGTGIMSEAPTKYGSYMTTIGSYISNTHITKTVTGTKETVTLTFKASGSTVYWVWNMANCSDSYNNNISIKVTNFSATHSGGKITYYSG